MLLELECQIKNLARLEAIAKDLALTQSGLPEAAGVFVRIIFQIHICCCYLGMLIFHFIQFSFLAFLSFSVDRWQHGHPGHLTNECSSY